VKDPVAIGKRTKANEVVEVATANKRNRKLTKKSSIITTSKRTPLPRTLILRMLTSPKEMDTPSLETKELIVVTKTIKKAITVVDNNNNSSKIRISSSLFDTMTAYPQGFATDNYSITMVVQEAGQSEDATTASMVEVEEEKITVEAANLQATAEQVSVPRVVETPPPGRRHRPELLTTRITDLGEEAQTSVVTTNTTIIML
jgi:hypothetical protein